MDIRLKTLELENFKCHKSLHLDLGGGDVCIRGDNAAGKTSVYDAFVWLLFGKDSSGNASSEVKPLGADGNVLDHEAVTAVEAGLLVDGAPLRLRRTLRENWNVRRGEEQPAFEGNTSEYFVDGVPCRAGAFRAKVAELVDEEKFRLLTAVNAFAVGLPWQKRRELLFDLFGGLDDGTVMETDPRFGPLAEELGSLTLEELHRRCTHEKRGLTVTKNEIPARISECERTVSDLAGLDFTRAEADAAFWTGEAERIAQELLQLENPAAVQSLRMGLREAELECRTLETEQRAAVSRTGALQADSRRLETEKKRLVQRLAECARNAEALLREWESRQGTSFTGGSCPTCGQLLAGEALRRSEAEFSAQKQRDLQRLETERSREEARANQYAAELARTEEALGAAREKLSVGAQEEPPRLRELKEQIRREQEELVRIQQDSRRAVERKRAEQEHAKQLLSEAQGILAKRSALEYARERITALRVDGAAAAEKLRKVEQLLYWMEEFGRYKASFVESGINGRFRLASFRLFREQFNGGVEERCDVVYDGVPYAGLNTGMRTNVGIDIINTLSCAYGVTVPLFVDNAESITELEAHDGQLIRLTVDGTCRELRVERG